MQHYLFVHFREKTSPDGEQVHFAVSRDGFHWQALNGGHPVLWAYYGDRGVRDMTIVRDHTSGKFHIFATDLSLSYGMRNQYQHSWRNIGLNGSRDLAHWVSDDLVHWSEEEMVRFGTDDMGCVWAPDVIFDREHGEYLVHWSSKHRCNNFGNMAIYGSRTKDFVHYSEPELIYRKPDSSIIDSAMYEEKGKFYLFVKSSPNPDNLLLLVSDHVNGKFERVEGFDDSMGAQTKGMYEAPTAVKLADGRWCLFADFYGAGCAGQGYVPFVSDDLTKGVFTRADEAFHFPYGFKHGTILPITEEEYERMLARDWTDVPDLR